MIWMLAVAGSVWAAPAWAQDAPVPGTTSSPSDAEGAATVGSNVPEGLAVGFGIGIVAPTSTWAPNTASARIRVADGVALEPSVLFSLSNSRAVAESPDVESVNAERSGTARVGLNVRGTAATRDNVELVALGGGTVTLAGNTTDPDGDDNNSTTSVVGASLSWGLGANWWLHRSFCLSADVQNPLLSISQDRQRAEAVDDSFSGGSSMNVSLAFAPSVRMMGHVVF